MGSIVFSVLLIVTAIVMLVLEIRAFRRDRIIRCIRRLLVAGSIGAIGVCFYYWHIFSQITIKDAHAPLTLLSILETLVLAVLLLAVWDAIDGIRSLRHAVDEMHKEDLTELQHLLKKAQEPEKPS